MININKMIKGICVTNLDGYDYEVWPEKFVAVPKINSKVRSSTGKILKVVGITHCEDRIPFIGVELNT